MAHYAFINSNNKVVEVITGKDESDIETLPEGFSSWEDYYASKKEGLICKRTSYNTSANTHALGDTPFRGNYAGIGFTYDADKDAFLPPKPFSDWVLNETTFTWEAPVAFPSDANADGSDTTVPRKVYTWEESVSKWLLVREDTYNTETEEWVIGS